MNTKTLRALAGIGCAASLVACGSGGDGSVEAPVALAAPTTKASGAKKPVAASVPAAYAINDIGADLYFPRKPINSADQVVATRSAGFHADAFFWTQTGGLRQLPALGARVDLAPQGINDSGVVVGHAGGGRSGPGGVRAFSWSPQTGVMTALDTLSSDTVLAYDYATGGVSSTGQIFGTSLRQAAGQDQGIQRAVSWTSDGRVIDFGSPSSLTADSGLYDTNRSGQSTGWIRPPGGGAGTRAALWSSTGAITELPSFGGEIITGRFISDGGHVVGDGTPPAGGSQAFFWAPGDPVLTRIETPNAGGMPSIAGVNSAGQVLGVYHEPSTNRRVAFVWIQKGKRIDIAPLDPNAGAFQGEYPVAINSAGQVVGFTVTATGEYRGWVWTEKSGIVDLNDQLANAPAGTVIRQPVAISESGSILAYTQSSAVLLTASPTVKKK